MWDSRSTYPTEYSKYQTIGASWVRTDVAWSDLQPNPGPVSSSYLSRLDAAVASAHANGMNSLLTVSSSPAWARPAGTTSAAPPTDPTTYASVLGVLATHYQGQGVALEFWNEPDISASFTGASAATYTTMACDAYSAIKAASPSTTVVAGAVSGEDINWLQQAYTAGLAGCYDVLSEHPYPSGAQLQGADPNTWEPILITPSVHALMAKYGDGAKPIWFTEIGFSAIGQGPGVPQAGQVTLAEQATFTVRFLEVVATTLPYVQVTLLYEGKDTASGSNSFEANLGLCNADLTPKPVFGAVQGLYSGTNVPPLPVAPALPPTATSVSPTSGPGTTSVTITGTNFTGATQVTFGTVNATSFTVDSTTQITAIAPFQGAGPHNVYVTTPYGTSAPVTADQFNYLAPVLTGINPISGPATGGTSVTITGTDFTGTTRVAFGAVNATSFTVNSDTQITAVAPAQAASVHAIYVTTPSGITPAITAAQFTYLAPSLSSISPSSGSTVGGTSVTITGTYFTGATQVAFGAVNATSFTVNSDTQITAVAPAQAASLHNIYVTTPGGTTAGSAAAQFSYVAPIPPSMTGISPAGGPTTGGTAVTITGAYFTGATKVAFGNVNATSFTVNSDTQITAVSPAQAGGGHNVYVTTPIGTTPSSPSAQFTYQVPSVVAMSPTSGPSGAQVTITGVNFTGATQVAFGSVNATSFTVNSDTQITAVAPGQGAGPHNVYVTTPSGTTSPVSADQFNYLAPVLTAISPSSGPNIGGTPVTITGTDFTGTTQVAFGAVNATSFTVNSDTQITAVAPAQAASVHDIYVTTPSGTTPAITPALFTYLPPTVTALNPLSGPTTGGTTVTITGTYFTGATQVVFGAVNATSFTVDSDTQITAFAPAQAASIHNVYVTTPGGTTAGGAAAQFTYVPTGGQALRHARLGL